jgi:hypothetical protein
LLSNEDCSKSCFVLYDKNIEPFLASASGLDEVYLEFPLPLQSPAFPRRLDRLESLNIHIILKNILKFKLSFGQMTAAGFRGRQGELKLNPS